MELLLNLAWLLLALPAYWLWRGRKTAHKFSSLQCLLALGCILVILFPVVSATDDLRAMRAEMEESPLSKRSLHQATSGKATNSHSAWQVPVTASSLHSSVIDDESWLQAASPSLVTPAAPAIERAGRAPPLLG